MNKWIVDSKGIYGDNNWEISVLKESNTGGKESYGHFGPHKIYISSGNNITHKVNRDVWTKLVRVASDIANDLNRNIK
jgi:hypothetical protein